MLGREEIEKLIPHRDPFLWIDEVSELTETRLVGSKLVRADLDLFRGHYPRQPILPGVMLCEAAMQAGAVLIASRGDANIDSGKVPVATRLNNVKFRQMVKPGDRLEIEVELTERLADAFFMTGKIRVRGKLAAQLEFACTVAVAN